MDDGENMSGLMPYLFFECIIFMMQCDEDAIFSFYATSSYILFIIIYFSAEIIGRKCGAFVPTRGKKP